MTTQDSQYLTVDEAAEYLNTSPRFIRRLIAERRITFHKAGALVRLNTSDLDRFMREGRVEPATGGTESPHDRGQVDHVE
ncbi:helix-turn-helix domain-containing protein [Amycolatopsis minnesotensis]|uniref:Helix-turn-helix domain-containing protein n=1 Tax=Amycolatopsis minnesotensis TaxID=337894 RepID=A0ABP5EA27_9PSEU